MASTATPSATKEHRNPVQPYRNKRQQFAVLQLCHEQLQVQSAHPGVRILGFHGTKALAERAVLEMRQQGILDDVLVYPTMEPLLCCSSRSSLADSDYRREKVTELLRIRNDWLKMREDELEERMNRERELASKEKEEKKAAAATTENATKTLRGRVDTELHKKFKNPYRNREGRTALGKTTTRAKALARKRKLERQKNLAEKQEVTEVAFPRNLEVRDQDYAVFGYIEDVTKGASKQSAEEPVFWFFGGFPNENAATDWITRSAAEKVMDPPLMVVRMYEWLYPTAVDTTRIKEIYENKEVGSLISAWKDHENLLDDFVARCKEKGLPIPASGFKPEQYEQMVQEQGIVNVRPYDGDDDPEQKGDRVVASASIDPETGEVGDVAIYEGPHKTA